MNTNIKKSAGRILSRALVSIGDLLSGVTCRGDWYEIPMPQELLERQGYGKSDSKENAEG